MVWNHKFWIPSTHEQFHMGPCSPFSSYNLIGPKWILKTKRYADGFIEWHKAHLVAEGFYQQEMIDYLKTFSLVIKPVTMYALLSFFISSNWLIHQIDIQIAFLQWELDEDVYMSQPLGLVHPNFSNHVCKLNKAIYSVKQVPKA